MYPELLNLGSYLTVRTYWLVISIGLLISSLIFLKIAKRKRVDLKFLWDHQLPLLLFVIFAARLTYYFLNFETYPSLRENLFNFRYFFYIWDQGVSIWGGIFGFILIFIFLGSKNDENIKKWLDTFLLPFFVLMLFLSLGELFDGQNYGTATGLPWGITYSNMNVKYTVPVHPTQIYTLLFTLGLIIFITKYLKHEKFFKKDGHLSIASFGLFALFIFFNGFILGDDTLQILFLRLDQIMALIALLFSIIYIFHHYRQEKLHPENDISTPVNADTIIQDLNKPENQSNS